MKFFAWMCGLALAVFSWSQLVAPPIVKIQEGVNPRAVFWHLLNPFSSTIYDSTPFGGWAFLLVTFGILLLLAVAARWLMRYVSESTVAMSILETDVRITFDKPDLERATISRKQSVHANQKGVQAYRASVTITQEGAWIDTAATHFQSELNNENITAEVLDLGNPNSREIIEIFKRPLTPNFAITFLPNNAVISLRRHFKKHIVDRTTKLVQVGEFNGPNAHFALNAVRYPVTNVTINIVFPNETCPHRNDVRAFIITDNVAKRVDAIPHPEGPGETRFSISENEMKQATLLVTWKNDRLLAWREARKQVVAARPRANALAPNAPSGPARTRQSNP